MRIVVPERQWGRKPLEGGCAECHTPESVMRASRGKAAGRKPNEWTMTDIFMRVRERLRDDK